MNKKLALAASLLTAFVGAAQAQTQTVCSCDSTATRTASATALTSLLTNRMVCASVGNEAWQEWHNGTSIGPVVDYKLGPGDKTDPSSTVGTYSVNGDNTVTYNYAGGGGNYTYDVCLASGGASYTFCGATYGGRNITGARIGGSGLTPCASVVNTTLAAALSARARKN